MSYFKTSGFSSIEEAKKELKDARDMYNQMVGTLYRVMVYQDIIDIENEIRTLKYK